MPQSAQRNHEQALAFSARSAEFLRALGGQKVWLLSGFQTDKPDDSSPLVLR